MFEYKLDFLISVHKPRGKSFIRFRLHFFLSCHLSVEQELHIGRSNFCSADIFPNFLKSDKALEELNEKGYTIGIVFSQVGNEKKYGIDFEIKSKTKLDHLKLITMKFLWKNQVVVKKINKIFALEERKTDENIYFYSVDRNVIKEKIPFISMFKKMKCNYGDEFPLLLEIILAFDNNEPVKISRTYNVKCYERINAAPNWMYLLFPHM